MSDSPPIPDAAIEAIRARIAELNLEIEQHQRLAETARVVRDELSDIVATISRKPRSRKPRVVIDAAEATEETPRQTVFATPCLGDVPQEAA
jgi:hypothetical protein